MFHQGDRLFGSLFVYGPDGRARWYTASKMTGGQATDRPSIYSGPLYESAGPAIGTPFDPSRVARSRVNSMAGTCTMQGTRTQYGRQVAASGAYGCGSGTIGRIEGIRTSAR